MRYYSTSHHNTRVGFREAILRSETADGGLYMPEKLPLLPKAVINNLPWMSLSDIAYVVNSSVFGDEFAPYILKRISDESTTYLMPTYEIEDGIYVMELFHGPTKTVKDFGALSLTKMIQNMLADTQRTLNVMVATTGHSGNAIASALHDTDRVNVFVLYPKGVARHHVEHINTLGDNVHTIEVNGSIDDSRRLINAAFNDADLNQNMMLTSANSMNIGSLMSSTIPFFHGLSQIRQRNDKAGDIYVSVPCGNGGNILAGYIAKMMGLPITRLVAACNANAGIHRYMQTGVNHTSDKAITTLAYGMDRPYSANVPRLEMLCDGDMTTLRRDIATDMVTDPEIAYTINDVYNRTGYLLDPHSAVAYCALKRNKPKRATGLVMATAHPSLSAENLMKINEGSIKLPVTIKKKNYCSRAEISIAPAYGALKKYLNYFLDSDSLSSWFA